MNNKVNNYSFKYLLDLKKKLRQIKKNKITRKNKTFYDKIN